MPDRHTKIPKTTKHPSRTDRIAAKSAEGKTREKLIDEAVEDSFPASDPPSYMGGATTGRRGSGRASPTRRTRKTIANSLLARPARPHEAGAKARAVNPAYVIAWWPPLSP